MDAIELKKQIERAAASGDSRALLATVNKVQDEQFESDIRSAKIGFGVLVVLLGLIGPVMIVGGLRVWIEAHDAGGFVLCGLGLLSSGLSAMLAKTLFAISPPPRALADTGLPARAKVEDYRSAFGSFNVGRKYARRSISRVAIDLSVTPSAGSPYRVTITQHLPGHALARLTVGAELQAFIDRSKSDRIYLVLDRV